MSVIAEPIRQASEMFKQTLPVKPFPLGDAFLLDPDVLNELYGHNLAGVDSTQLFMSLELNVFQYGKPVVEFIFIRR